MQTNSIHSERMYRFSEIIFIKNIVSRKIFHAYGMKLMVLKYDSRVKLMVLKYDSRVKLIGSEIWQ